MKRSRGWISLALVLAVAACAADANDGDVADANEPMAESDMAGDTMEPMAESQTLALAPITDEAIAGEATITGMGNQVRIMVRLTGAPPESSHPGHIHTGTCENVGGVVQPLETVQVDATGTGTVTTTLDVPAMSIMDGNHTVVYHGEGGAPATCAAIPMHAM